MRTIRTVREMRAALHEPRAQGRRIGLVPTMGALHDGHAALLRAARAECDLVVTSLFVNPIQFGVGEDYARYPRDERSDAAFANECGVDLLFAPSDDEMYPPGFAVSIDPGPVALILCGGRRPDHFAGVATVVARLIGIVGPEAAFFGLKDYQQTVVVRRVVSDLAMDVEIRTVPTVREPDGLAMSSRNRSLDPASRRQAAALFGGLRSAADRYATGERGAATLVAEASGAAEAVGLSVEYLELRDAETLGGYTPERAAVLAAAVRCGDVRLIDNVLLAPTHLPTARGVVAPATRSLP